MGDAETLEFPAQASLTRRLLQANSDTARRAFLPLWAGQAASLVRDLPAATLINTLVAEARRLIAKPPAKSRRMAATQLLVVGVGDADSTAFGYDGVVHAPQSFDGRTVVAARRDWRRADSPCALVTSEV